MKPVEPARLKGFLPREVPGFKTTTRTADGGGILGIAAASATGVYRTAER
ncbi:MAG: hypothetical protein U1F87_00785 [Kiritimatiellia bacterium]